MSERETKLKALLEKLEMERDELKLKFGLAKLEAKEEWQELEKKIDGLRGRMKVVGEETRDATGDVGSAFELIGDEIKEGFARIRKLF